MTELSTEWRGSRGAASLTDVDRPPREVATHGYWSITPTLRNTRPATRRHRALLAVDSVISVHAASGVPYPLNTAIPTCLVPDTECRRSIWPLALSERVRWRWLTLRENFARHQCEARGRSDCCPGIPMYLSRVVEWGWYTRPAMYTVSRGLVLDDSTQACSSDMYMVPALASTTLHHCSLLGPAQ